MRTFFRFSSWFDFSRYIFGNQRLRSWTICSATGSEVVPGLKILGIHFGEPGKGKGPCDKYFAIIRAHQRRCIKDQYDANTPKAFAENMCRYGINLKLFHV